MPNKLLSPEKFVYHVLLLCYLFRDEKESLFGFPALYQYKLPEQRVQYVVNINKIKFEPDGDLVVHANSKFNETLIHSQDPHRQY